MKDTKLDKATKDSIILDYNLGKTTPELAKKYGIKATTLKGKISKWQMLGIIRKKREVKSKVKKEGKTSLAELLGGIESSVETESISTLHKEMLVEILHRIIVK
jgi:transposase